MARTGKPAPQVTVDAALPTAHPPRARQPSHTRVADLPPATAPLLAGFIALPSLLWWISQASMVLNRPGGFDFTIYYAAALALRDNPHADLFDLHVLQAAAHAHHAPLPLQAYLYPPLLAILLQPLTRLPFVDAARAWAEINLVLWLLATLLLASLFAFAVTGMSAAAHAEARGQWRALRQQGLGAWLRDRLTWGQGVTALGVSALGIAAFASLSNEPTIKGLILGQVSTSIYFLLVLVPWLLLRRQQALAGVALALAAGLKVFPLLLIGYFLLRGRWRVVAGAIAGLAVVVGLMIRSVGVQGLLAIRQISRAGVPATIQGNNHALARVPLWIGIELGYAPGPTALRLGSVLIGIVAALFLAGMLVTVWAEVRAWRAARAHIQAPHTDSMYREFAGYSWALCTMLLVSPVVWEHYGAWLLPAFACGLGYAAQVLMRPQSGTQTPWRTRGAVLLALAVMLAYAATARTYPFKYDGQGLLVAGPYLGNVAIRPLYMVLRPLTTALVWMALGWYFIRPALAAARLAGGSGALSRLPTRAGQGAADEPASLASIAERERARDASAGSAGGDEAERETG